MYFFKQGEHMCHILADAQAGIARCGAEMSGLELWRLQAGRPAKRLTPEKPPDIPLCPRCEVSSPADSVNADNQASPDRHKRKGGA